MILEKSVFSAKSPAVHSNILLKRASFAHDVDPPILRPSRKYTRVEIKSSIVDGNEGVYFDAGLSMGRSFRVGWGPGGRLVHRGTICSPFAVS